MRLLVWVQTLLLAGGVWIGSGVGAIDIDDLVYKALPAEAACVRLLTRTGQVGCSIANGRGVLYDVQDVLRGRVYDATYSLAVLIPYSSLNQTMIATIKGRYKLAGLFVHSLATTSASSFPSPAEKSPFSYLSPESRQHVWNPNGSDLASLDFDFAIVSVKDADRPALQQLAEQNRQRIQEGKDPRNEAQFNYQMDANRDSINCLRSGRCMPIGGFSVWTTKGDNKNSAEPIVAAVAQLDASAFIHSQALGGKSAMSGLLALLGASDTVAKIAETDLQKRIVFAAFNGEFYDLIGSRSFVKDLSSFNCSTTAPDSDLQCLNPYRVDTSFTSISKLVQSGSTVVDISQVGSGALTDPFYFHTHSAALTAAINSVSTDQPMKTLPASAVSTIGLPPSSAWAFPSAVEKVVLAGFDTEFNSPLYGSDLDTVLSDVALQRVCSASTIVARVLLSQAGYGNASSVSANCTLIEELADCVGPNGFECDLARRVMSSAAIAASTSSKKGDVTHYASVYQPLSSSQIVNTPRLINDWWASVNLSAHYHDAVDPDLSIGSDGFWHAADSPGRLWTESNWIRQRVRVYVTEAPWSGAIMLVSGFVVAAVAITSSYFLSKFAIKTIKLQ